MYEKLTGYAERLYAVEDIVTGYMYKVDAAGITADAFVAGEHRAAALDKRLTEWSMVREALTTNPEVTLDDIRKIMGVTND